MISKKGSPEQFISELTDQIARLSSRMPVESDTDIYDRPIHEIENEVREGYTRKGFDITDPDVKMLIDDTVEYLSHAPSDYTFDDWYIDTMADYPEFFESVTAAASGVVDFTNLPDEQDESDMEDIGITGKNDIAKIDLIDWLSEHDQAYSDICDAFGTNDLEDLSYDQILDWISDHDRLMEDCMNHFGHDVFMATSTSNIIAGSAQVLAEIDQDYLWDLIEAAREEIIGRHEFIDDVDITAMEDGLATSVEIDSTYLEELAEVDNRIMMTDFFMPYEQLTLDPDNIPEDADVIADDVDAELDEFEFIF